VGSEDKDMVGRNGNQRDCNKSRRLEVNNVELIDVEGNVDATKAAELV
jgi:hypothetical protein